MFVVRLTLSLPSAIAVLQGWALERAAGEQNHTEGSKYLAESQFYEMPAREPTDDLGRTIVKLLHWMLLVDILIW